MSQPHINAQIDVHILQINSVVYSFGLEYTIFISTAHLSAL